MTNRIPLEAYTYYAGLGAARSYEAVAKHFGVSRRGIAKLAQRDDWPGQVEEAEKEALRRSQLKVIESLEDMNDRHLKMARIVQTKALEALRTASMDDPMKASHALVKAIQLERMLRGNAGEQEELDLMDVVREEGRKLLKWVETEDGEDDVVEGGDGAATEVASAGASQLEGAVAGEGGDDGEAP